MGWDFGLGVCAFLVLMLLVVVEWNGRGIDFPPNHRRSFVDAAFTEATTVGWWNDATDRSLIPPST